MRSARRSSAAALALVAVLLGSALPGRSYAQSAPIFLDGRFGDWVGTLEFADPAGDDGSTGIDFVQVDLANDDDFLFIRFQTTVEVGLQNGAPLSLYIDADDDAGTGLSVAGIGAELEWNFGARNGNAFDAGGSPTFIRQDDIRLRQLPSVTASEFEIAIGRDVSPGGGPLFSSGTIRVTLSDTDPGGDQAPDGSGGILYTFDATPVAPPAPITFAKADPGDVRLVSWNARDLEDGSGGFEPAVFPSADRLLDAIQPDVICFQEVRDPTAAQTGSYVSDILPLLGPWHAAKENDCVTVSRYPIVQSWPLDGNLATLLDSDAALGVDLLIVNAHLPCCSNDGGRQNESDHIMSFFRDAMTPGGAVDVPAGTAFVIAGDLNLVGLSQQLATLLTGDIVNEGTYGPDFNPDWDGSSLTDVISAQTEMRFAYTWRNDNSTFAPGRLDFLIYNDSVLEVGNQFIVYSPEMSAAELAATGIQSHDVPTTSDHLPHVADFRQIGGVVAVTPAVAQGLALGSAIGRGELRFALELGVASSVEIDVFDVRGRRVRSLFAGAASFAAGRHTLRWDARDDRGRRTPSGMYIARARTSGAGHRLDAAAKWILLR